MNVLVLPFPEIGPIALEIGPLSIRWYGLAYMAGLLLGWMYIRSLLKNERLWSPKPAFDVDLVDDLLIWTTLGVVIGGRVGFFLFYEPTVLLKDPSQFFYIWNGGMAFHGGLLGTGLAFYLFARRNKISFFSVMDVAAAAVPIGLFFGRMANFINAEIVGKVTNVPWAMVFPGAGPEPRHPTQLYEAALEGIVLFLVLRYFTHSRLSLTRPGETVGIFLIGYGLARIFAEIFKEHDHEQFFTVEPISAGMVYSLPMVLLGIYFYWHAQKNSQDVEKPAT